MNVGRRLRVTRGQKGKGIKEVRGRYTILSLSKYALNPYFIGSQDISNIEEDIAIERSTMIGLDSVIQFLSDHEGPSY